MTYLQSKELKIVLKIPLINTKEAYKVLKVYHFCNPETAFYQANINKLCIMALFNIHGKHPWS